MRWFSALLQEAAHWRSVRSPGRCNPRMLKRRNSPYASHDRSLQINVQTNFSPHLLAPLPLPKRKIYGNAKKGAKDN